MIRFLLIFTLILFQQADPIKAISYNIRYNNPKDGMNVWENRRGTVASLLNEESADFVGLQEVVYPQLQDLVQSLKGYDHIGVGRKDGKTKGNTVPFFIKKKNLSFWNPKLFGYPRPLTPFQRVGMPLRTHLYLWPIPKPKDPRENMGFQYPF